MQSKCILRVVDDDTESPFKITYLVSFYKVVSVFVSLC